MRRIGIVMTLGLALLVSAYGQTPQSSGQTPQSQGQAAKPKQTAKFKGKILIERLPKGVEGVVLDKDTGSLKLKSGYEFVRKNASTVKVVRRMAGGGRGGVVFEGSCDCRASTPGLEAPGECSVTIMDPVLYCTQGSCAGNCNLTVTVGGKKLSVIMY